MDLEFLDGQQPEPVAAPEPQAEQPTPDGPARAPDGKFAAKEPEPAPQPEAPVSPAPAVIAQPATPPESDIETRLRAEFEEKYGKQLKGLQSALTATRQEKRQPAPTPDPFVDFDAYDAHQRQEHQAQLFDVRMQTSRRIAEIQHGADYVQQVHEWADQRCAVDPVFNQQVLANPSPYEFAAQHFQREQAIDALSKMTPAQLAALTNGGAIAPTAPTPTPINPPSPPRSQASAPSAGTAKPGEQPVGPGVAFDAIF